MYICKKGHYIGLYHKGYIDIRMRFNDIDDKILISSFILHKKSAIKKEKYHKERAKAIHNLKTNGCAICGYDKCDDALNFHHVNPQDKKYTIGQNKVFGRNIIEEINKCILLCSNCHMEIHKKERLYNEV